MVVATSWTALQQQEVKPGQGLDGVVYIAAGNYAGTGTLLYDGRAILTAAHVVEGFSARDVSVRFETPSGTVWRDVTQVVPYPGYSTLTANGDLALLWLAQPAPAEAERRDLYRQDDELGKSFMMVGYGNTGTGQTGETTTVLPVKHYAVNTFETTATRLKEKLGGWMGWYPSGDVQLLADFDDGTSAHDALGQFGVVRDTGVGVEEGMLGGGDSGGPALIDGKVAGVANYGVSLRNSAADPDIDGVTNSTFGELGGWQRVSSYQQWIDEQVRKNYQGAPENPEEVSKVIRESDSGTQYVWFLLQFTGEREVDQPVSVSYRTVDGTARAGEDYVPVSGTVVLYPDEDHVAIPVEVIGDTRPEPNETFWLEVYDPVGGSFGEGVETLRAMRTIVDDDGYLIA